jgi:gas vesicle protein
MRGIIGFAAGVAAAAAAYTWYRSQSGQQVREQYDLDRRFSEIGSQIEKSTRDISTAVNSQIADIQARSGSLEEAGETASEAAEEAADRAEDAADRAEDAAAWAADAAESTVDEAEQQLDPAR